MMAVLARRLVRVLFVVVIPFWAIWLWEETRILKRDKAIDLAEAAEHARRAGYAEGFERGKSYARGEREGANGSRSWKTLVRGAAGGRR